MDVLFFDYVLALRFLRVKMLGGLNWQTAVMAELLSLTYHKMIGI